MENKFPPLKVNLQSSDGNIFAMLTLVRQHLREHYVDNDGEPEPDQVFESIRRRVFASESYEEALRIIGETVPIIDLSV